MRRKQPLIAEESGEQEPPFIPKWDSLVEEALAADTGSTSWVPLRPETLRERLLLGGRRYGFGALFMSVVVISAFFFYGYRGTGQDASLEELLSQVKADQGIETPSGSAQAAPAEPADLSIETFPAGATVLVDFDSVGITPLWEHRLNPGVYVVSVRKPDYAALDTVVFVSGGETPRLAFLLKEAVEQEPAAEEPGSSTQTLTDATIQIVRPPETTAARPRTARAAQTGRLLVTSEPSGVSVYLNEESIGTTPLLFQEATPGQHQITMRKDGYKPYTAAIDVGPDETAKVDGKLQALGGQLIVLVQPWGSIYIDEELHKRDTDVQYVTQLPVGTHRVKAVHPTLGTLERVVRITGDTPQQLVIHFTPSAAQSTADSEAARSEETSAPEEGNSIEPEGGIYPAVDEAPVLIGGLEGLHRDVQYPRAAYDARREGRVYLSFVVDERGRVQDARVMRGIGLGCDEEALRAIRRARFEPGKIDGKPVKVRHSLFINFQISESE